jgi:hypothetical protein
MGRYGRDGRYRDDRGRYYDRDDRSGFLAINVLG